MTLTFCGYPVGAAFGALVATQLSPRFGWPAVFQFGGVTTLFGRAGLGGELEALFGEGDVAAAVLRQRELGHLADRLTHAMPPMSPALQTGVSNGSDNGARPATAATLANSGSLAHVTGRAAHAVTQNCVVRVFSIEQLQRQTEIETAGIVVLSGPVAKLSRICALSDLSAASGWPILGVVGVPRTRSNWQKPAHDHQFSGPPPADGTIAGGVGDPVAQTTGR